MYSLLDQYTSFVYHPPKREHFRDSPPFDMIFYINLDNRTDRKHDLERELKAFHVPFERFSAVRHSNGALGCSKSHLAVWKLAKERGYRRILVLEDDFTFLVSKSEFEEEMDKVASVPYDVCMISYNMLRSSPTEHECVHQIHDGQTTSGYLLNVDYIDTFIGVVEPSLGMLEKTGNNQLYAIDVVMKQLQKKDKWYHTTRRIGIQKAGFSDIEQRHVNYKV